MLEVAAGVLIKPNGQVLLAQRPEGKHMAGYWEFPGGKFEAGENAQQALARELHEELGICINASEPLIQLQHHYPERSVRLHVRVVREWQGQPQGLDQQALAWVQPSQLTEWRLLPADAPIINALCLPSSFVVSPDIAETQSWQQLKPQLTELVNNGMSLLQWRQTAFKQAKPPSLSALRLAESVAAWAADNNVRALLNCEPTIKQKSWASQLGFVGIQLTTDNLLLLAASFNNASELATWRQTQGLQLIAASCHDEASLTLAARLALNFAVLGPVLPTPTHPQQAGLGWPAFADLALAAQLPIYAIGGCSHAQLNTAIEAGGQGVAGISGFWPA